MDYAENPQITYLREAYEAKVKECEELKDCLDEIYDECSIGKCRLLASQNSVKEWERKYAILQQKYDELCEDVELFNCLPWYEKMFHKFDV